MGWAFNPFTGNFDNTGPATSPAGSDGYIQFNDSGAFGAEAYLFWDKTNNALGVQTSTPLSPAHIVAETGTEINSVVTASVTTVDQSLNTSPTGSITLIAEFAAISGSIANQNTSGSGYTANGQTIDYQIYQVIQGTNGTYYASSQFELVSFTDTINDGMTGFSVVVTLGTVNAETTHLLVEKQVNGGGFNDSEIVAVNTSYEDFAFSGNASNSAWPTQYVLSYTEPTPPSGLSGQEINVGSGNLSESGTTYDFEIRSAANVGGTYYCEQVGDAGNFTDANAANTFDLQVDWTPGSGDEQVIRISSNGGSTWDYQFVGGMSGSFVWSNQGNDSAAETAWSNAISGVQVEYAFKAYAKNTSPGGQVVYNPSANTYYATLTTPNVYYIFKHVLTGFLSPGAKVLGDYNSGVSNGLDLSSATLIDPGYSTWGSGTTITPTTYAFSSGSTRYFKLVGTDGTIYSPTPLVVNATTSGSQYFSGSFSYPSGVTTVKALVSTDNVTYSGSKTINSPTTTFTYDTTDTTWSGSTTITPTASVPTAHRIDRQQSLKTDVPHLSLVDITGSGTRYMSIGFGISSSKSNSVSSYVAKILAESSTGYLLVGSPRLVGYTSSAYISEAWRLGSTYDFNLNAGSSAHFTYWSATASTALAYFYAAGDSNRGTVYFGQQTTSFGTSSKVVIAPTAGGTVALHFRRTSGFAGDNILIDSAGSFVAGWGQSGRMYLNATSVSTTTWLRIGGSSSGSQIRLEQHGTASVTTNGDLWHDPNSTCLAGYYAGVKQYYDRTIETQVVDVAVANTTTETTLLSTTSSVGTYTLPSNFFKTGRSIIFRAYGKHSTTASPNLTMRFKLGSTTVCTTGAHAMHNDTNSLWEIYVVLTCRTTGASGTVYAQGYFRDFGTAGDTVQMVNTATTTIDTTSSLAVNLTAQWGTASASNTITCTNAILEAKI